MLKEHEFRVDSTGIWIKTRVEQIEKCMRDVIQITRDNGYNMTWAQNIGDTLQLTLLNGSESIIINAFTNGDIQFCCMNEQTSETIVGTIIPKLGQLLGVAFIRNILDKRKYKKRMRSRKKKFVSNYASHTNKEIEEIKSTPIIMPPPVTRQVEINCAVNQRDIKNLSYILKKNYDELINLKEIVDRSQTHLVLLKTDVRCMRREFENFKIDTKARKEVREEEMILETIKNKNRINENLLRKIEIV